MTGVLIGMNLKYLPWQLSLSIMVGLSILGVYGAITTKGESKILNIICVCCAIGMFFMAIESLAINTGIFAQYLPFVKLLDWFVFFIIIMVLFFFGKTS